MPSFIVDPVIEPKPLDLIKPAAVDAYKATVTANGDAGMKAVLNVLADSVPVKSLKIVDIQDGLVVVTDGTTYLAAVGDPWQVYLVTFIDKQWTRKERVTSLVELGKALA
jgi:hypothetical protein